MAFSAFMTFMTLRGEPEWGMCCNRVFFFVFRVMRCCGCCCCCAGKPGVSSISGDDDASSGDDDAVLRVLRVLWVLGH